MVCSRNRIVTLGDNFQMYGSKDVGDPITCGLIVDDLLVLGSQDREKVIIFNRHTLETIHDSKMTKFRLSNNFCAITLFLQRMILYRFCYVLIGCKDGMFGTLDLKNLNNGITIKQIKKYAHITEMNYTDMLQNELVISSHNGLFFVDLTQEGLILA